jgi:serine/threonine-protein kinase RsbT
MPVLKEQTLPLTNDTDIVQARQSVRRWAEELKFSLVEQTKVVTAASELARNTVLHGGGGTVRIEILNDGLRNGLKIIFEDKGPGIQDIDLAMKDGYTTGNGLGLGLGGAKRLVSDFEIQSRTGEGTRVSITRWK